MRYAVWFNYNGRGRSSVRHVVRCELPEGVHHWEIDKGFWINDEDREALWKGNCVRLARGPMQDPSVFPDLPVGTMFVPPGRITSVLPCLPDNQGTKTTDIPITVSHVKPFYAQTVPTGEGDVRIENASPYAVEIVVKRADSSAGEKPGG